MDNEPETMALQAQGAVCLSEQSGWRLGWLTLGSSTLTFRPPGTHGVVRIDLENVTRLDVERRRFVVTGKRVVRLTYRPRRVAYLRSCWVITARLGDWEEALNQRVGVRVSQRPPALAPQRPLVPPHLVEGMAGLSSTAGLVLDYLAYRGHATTAELVALTGVETEEALLFHLYDGFGRIEPMLGGAAIRYEGVHFDRRSGATRQQSWWVDEVLADSWLAQRIPTDVLVEGDELVVVTSMPTQARRAVPSAHVDSQGQALVVRGAGGYERWIALPEQVVGTTQCAMNMTGTLVIRVRRKKCDSPVQPEGPQGGGRSRVASVSAGGTLDCQELRE